MQKKHTHQFRPTWLLLTSPGDLEGWQRIVAYARCLVCGEESWIAGEQNTRTMQSRMLEAGQ